MSEIVTFDTKWVPGKLYKMVLVPPSLSTPLYSPAQEEFIGSISKETFKFADAIRTTFKPTEASHNLKLNDVFMLIGNEFVWEQRYERADGALMMARGPSFDKAVIKSIEYIQVLIGDKLCIYCAGALRRINFGRVSFVEASKE